MSDAVVHVSRAGLSSSVSKVNTVSCCMTLCTTLCTFMLLWWYERDANAYYIIRLYDLFDNELMLILYFCLFPLWIVMWLIWRLHNSTEPPKHLAVKGAQSGRRWMMARPLSQLLPPDLPSAGASPQFGNSSQAGGSLNGGHLNSTANLKSLLQLPVKGDQRVKDCSEMKGEETHLLPCHSLRVYYNTLPVNLLFVLIEIV